MGLTDVIWMVIIISAAGYLLYHSLWKKRGRCPGCGECLSCSSPEFKRDKFNMVKGDNRNEKTCSC